MDIYESLIFCADSILRVKSQYKEKEISYPLLDIQTLLKDDALFVLKVLDNPVSVEEGTTLSNIILAIEPWADIFSRLLGRDVKAYIKACRELTTKEQLFDFLEVSKRETISREFLHKPRKEGESLTDYFNRKRISTNNFKNESSLSMCGFNIGDVSNYSTSIAFSQIKNTPLYLTNKYKSYIYLEELNVDGIVGLEKDRGTVSFNSVAEYSLIDLLKAIFLDGLFYENPLSDEGYDNFNQMLSDSMEEIDIEKEQDEKEKNKLRLVSDDDELQDEDEIGKKKIVVAPNAFDGLVEPFKEIADFWDLVFEKIAKESNVKTGVLKTAERDESYQCEELKKE